MFWFVCFFTEYLPISADVIRFPERKKVTATTAVEDSKTDSACEANSTQLPNFGKIKVYHWAYYLILCHCDYLFTEQFICVSQNKLHLLCRIFVGQFSEVSNIDTPIESTFFKRTSFFRTG